MCFGLSTLGAGAKTRLHTPKAVTYHEQPHYCRFMIGHSLGRTESRIKEFTPHCVCRPCDGPRARRLLRNRQDRFQLLPLAPPVPPYYPFPRGKSILGVIYGFLLWADMNAATPLGGVWGRPVISLNRPRARAPIQRQQPARRRDGRSAVQCFRPRFGDGGYGERHRSSLSRPGALGDSADQGQTARRWCTVRGSRGCGPVLA